MLKQNLLDVKNKIAKVASQCGRNASEVRVVAVSKRFPPSVLRDAIDAGHFLFGENYIQEAASKKNVIGDTAELHFIGHLQTNKAKIACQLFQMIETVDRIKLAKALHKHLMEDQQTLKILIQVNIGRDPNKSGALPEDTETLLREIKGLSTLKVCGLMTIPPFTTVPEESRIHFRSLRLLAESMTKKNLLGSSHPVELSMGMSNDFHIAIEEGATLVRIGTAIFGPRHS